MEQYWTIAYCFRSKSPDLKAVMILGFFQQSLKSRHQHRIHICLQIMGDGTWHEHMVPNEFMLAERLYLTPSLRSKALYLTAR